MSIIDGYELDDLRDKAARADKAEAEIERLRAMVLDACKVFDHYDLPEHALHYRRALEKPEHRS